MSWEAIFDSEDKKETKEYTVVKPGNYSAFIEEAKILETKDPVEISLRWKITEAGEFKNRVLFGNYKVTPERKWALKRDLELLGLVCEAAQLPNELQTLVGKEAGVTVTTREWQGKTFNNIVPKALAMKPSVQQKDFASLSNMAPKKDDHSEIPF